MIDRLLLHICCAPCVSAVLEKIMPEYDVTGYFYNPNIYPESEYNLRLENLEKLIKLKKNNLKVEKYNVKNWQEKIKGLEKEKEGGKRCEVCIKIRLEKTAIFAVQHSFDIFGTTLSISPYKNTMMTNRIGLELEKKYGVKFLEEDFSALYKRSIVLCKENGIYRQKYCGCEYSIR
ncbi:MAG: epoxyqueuosine reductase QueH [Patescibacteria group bacterium]|nr:epoxyqueuosine reductase QueH [Patescibacteria group bacterium]